VEDVVAGEFADGGFGVDEVVEADGTGRLGEGDFAGGGFAGCFRDALAFGGVCVLGHFVEEVLGNVEAFDAKSFEVDFATGDTAGEEGALSPLDQVHDYRGGEDDG
jgi:hypothetical protein